MAAYQLNDPVHVKQASGKNVLDGIVAFLGKVDFADGDDWVGIKLTGSSTGSGKNDGTVKGTRYFACAKNNGLFVRKSSISKRTLSRLEELRLRRELASSSSSGGASLSITSPKASVLTGGRAGGIATPTPRGSTPSSGGFQTPPPTIPTPSSSVAKSAGAGAGLKSKSKLEELRQRRAALNNAQTATAETKPAAETETTPASSNASSSKTEPANRIIIQEKDNQVNALKKQLEDITKKYKAEQDKAEKKEEEWSKKEQEYIAATNANENDSAHKQQSPVVLSTTEAEDSTVKQLENDLHKAQNQIGSYTENISQLKSDYEARIDKSGKEIVSLTATVMALQDSSSATQQRDASQYKELAKIQADYSALKRKFDTLKNEKIDIEADVEDLTLDKDQLQEEKDQLEERLEELKIDAETAHMECEELRMELEHTRNAAAAGISANVAHDGISTMSTEDEDKAQALAYQNSRLREALIRLREQTSVEKIEITRQLKAAEKLTEESKKISQQLDKYKNSQSTMEEQLEDLKDMVEQGAAFEGMVEDLSDRLLSLEEDNGSLRTTIRELEEAAELTAEMEEVQADELKASYRDLEERDTVVRNMEEAIKMQRRREEDFSKTLGNYRKMVETLKREKEALLELQQGGEGEKSQLMATSQKALSRAAQLVSDAAEMRKREAQVVMDKIEGQVQRHLAERLERLLPQSVAGTEITALKGELLLCKVAGMASQSLHGISSTFTKNLRVIPLDAPNNGGTEAEEKIEAEVQLSDDTKQEVLTMSHQSECAHVLIGISSELLRFVVAGQWPDLLSENSSTELGAILSHSMSELETDLRLILTSLKQEGVISPHQSNIEHLRSTSVQVIEHLVTDLKEANIPLPKDWNAPGLRLFTNAAHAKYSCLGVGAIVAAAANDNQNNVKDAQFCSLCVKLGNLCTEATNACNILTHVNIQDNEVLSKLLDSAFSWKNESLELITIIRSTFCSSKEVGITKISREKLNACEKVTDSAISIASHFFSALRRLRDTIAGANTNNNFFSSSSNDTSISKSVTNPTLSPEADDYWDVVSSVVRAARKRDGDEEDVNYIFRAKSIETRLANAVGKEPKLSLANAKVASLEKSLSSRSKEIAMQNARLSELEKLLAKTSARSIPGKKSALLKSSEEFNSMKEENRVLMEAMDVLQRQVDEYENEIRLLKDMKTPKKGASRAGRRSVGVSDYSTDRRLANSRGDAEETQSVVSSAAVGALEAALFRPALNSALRDAAKWKGKAIKSTLLELPPLSVSIFDNTTPTTLFAQSNNNEEEKKENDDGKSYHDDDDMINSKMFELRSALSDFRMELASIEVVDITNEISDNNKHSTNPRALLRQSKASSTAAAIRLDTAAASFKRYLSNSYGQLPPANAGVVPDIAKNSHKLIGRVKVEGKQPIRNISTLVSKDDLLRFQLHMV